MGSLCSRCDQLCCRYITVKIDTPRSICDFDAIYWWMLHKGVHVFSDSSGWSLLAFADCLNMEGGLCKDYENRPFTCREHSDKDCEKRRGLKAGTELYFDSAAKLDAYCSKRFKTWKNRYQGL
jgi:uncharacterized protein